jgi:alkylation response protein AidB-like acyl-CoA dehydrogenase
MDLSYTPDQQAFRAEVRAWLRANVPTPPLSPPGTHEGFEAHRSWERTLSGAGYGGIAWPVEYGGRGADVVLQAIFEEEYLLADAPERVNVVGQKLMAPTVMRHGTDEQKRRWLPRILTSEDVWSQGFSEPEAGSDLAGIRTKAELSGDDYVVNGQKIWTSYGAFADWIFVLVRTDPAAERHGGITFLAVDMRTDGVEPRPIVQLDGHAGFAEVFFTDARVPAENVIGEPNDGWRVAMTTLGAEREAPARPAARYLRDLRTLTEITKRRDLDTDAAVQDELAKLYVEAKCYEHATARTLTRLARGEEIGVDASVTKLQWSELERRMFEMGLDMLGPHGASIDQPADGAEAFWHNYWYARAATIYAGTSEIQRNIVAERILGLPREPPGGLGVSPKS